MTPPDSKPKWVLVVDDDATISSILVESLSRSGFKAVSASSVGEAVTKLDMQRFDCVIVDMHLGKGSGERVISFMRGDGRVNQMTPILVISGFLDVETVTKVRAHVQSILVKPFNRDELMKRLGAVLTAPVALLPSRREEQDEDLPGIKPQTSAA